MAKLFAVQMWQIKWQSVPMDLPITRQNIKMGHKWNYFICIMKSNNYAMAILFQFWLCCQDGPFFSYKLCIFAEEMTLWFIFHIINTVHYRAICEQSIAPGIHLPHRQNRFIFPCSGVTSAKELETTSTFSMLNLHCLSRLKTAINLHQNLCGHLHVHLIFWNDHSNKPLKTRTFKEISGLPWVSLTADLFFFWNNNKYHLYRACLDTQGHWPEKHCIPAKTTWAHWVIGGLQNN